jgi:hypothetical protein
MVVKIKSAIHKESWYGEVIGLTMNLIDLGNPLYLFATLDGQLPVFRMDIDILENAKEASKKRGN